MLLTMPALRVVVVLLAAGLTVGVVVSNASYAQSETAAQRFLREKGLTSPPPLYLRALDTFLTAEAAYRRGDYASAQRTLDEFWSAHPPGTAEWSVAYREAGTIQRSTGINIGMPPCYYALRMLTDCVRYRLSPQGSAAPTNTVTLTAVLVGKARGIEPRSQTELQQRKGVERTYELEPALIARNHRIILDSLYLFREYMRAATDGRLAVDVRFEHLKDLQVPVHVVSERYRFAGLAGDAWQRIWNAVSPETKSRTDWWWVLYPSCVPEQYPDFTTTEFITGGMGTGPDHLSPCFIIDDRWLTRKPPHLGKGPYTDIERRAYLPQWLQHEFFHHLFRTYPAFKLEEKGHQWFDRSTWPADFQGVLEPDYYHEALHKRLRTQGDPPLHVALCYRPPSPSLFRRLKLEDIVGEYQHDPVENDWHMGKLEPAQIAGRPALRWTNKAGVSWILRPDLPRGLLLTGADCPYYDAAHPEASAVRIQLRRDASGRYEAAVEGFSFQGGLYRRKAGP